MSKPVRYALLTIVVVFLGIVLADTLGAFDSKPYLEIPHGNHSHYVPRDYDGTVPVGQFPTRAPGPNERVTQQGEIVPVN